jgi:peptide/nickel transport system substrate-binding protein
MRSWKSRKLFSTVAVLVPLALTACASNTLRVATHADLMSLDPVWTTAYITRNHGYLVYDTLFALDENFDPQPQMVDTWTVSDDRKTWTFKLRDGLKWHDGTDVTADDAVASLGRWGKRDGRGQQLFASISELKADDAKTIVMNFKVPYEGVPAVLGKLSSNVPFIMPKQVAQTDAFKPNDNFIGSGPFMFNKDKWVPGSKVVYDRNPNYVARAEPASLAAGSKEAQVDRIEWLYFADQTEAVKALVDGKVHYVESPPTKLVATLEENKRISVGFTDPVGNVALARFNHQQPPFDKPEIRRAVLMAMKQEDYMTAAFGDHKFWRTCYSTFPCGTAFSDESGGEIMKVGDLDAARAALKAAGYDGTPVVILHPTDIPVLSAFTKVTVEKLRSIGMKVEVRDMDWATLTLKRNIRGSTAAGGWSMFHTWWIAADVEDPTAIAFSGDPETGWFGWADDKELEGYRADFAKAPTLEEKEKLAAKVQERLWAIGASGHLGQFFEPVAYRDNVKGITSPVQFYWTVSVE